ncbi:MAG: hypothetical protein WB779_10360 [Ignavibacteriaceae bacterium]
MNNIFKSNRITFLVIIFSLFYIGCGSNQVLITPNYKSEELNLKARKDVNAKVIMVIDDRKEKADNLGIAQVGILNKKVPYNLDQPVSEFVRKSVTQMLSTKEDSLFLPLKIVIHKFMVWERTDMFSETGHFYCDLSFIYPMERDSFDYVDTQADELSSSLDVTNGLEELMYEGISKTTESFLEKYREKSSTYLASAVDSTIFGNNIEPVSADANITETIDTSSSQYNYRKVVAQYVVDEYVGPTYSAGKNIKYGIQFLYQRFNKLGSHAGGGFGYLFLYYNVENPSKFLKGSFVNFGYRYDLRYFLSPGNKGLYLSGGMRLAFGNEKINYGSREETHFFFGPTLEEALGVSINNRILLELGAFQLKFWGSDMLPDDVGYSFGMYIRI